MHLIFTKRTGKHDELRVERDSGPAEIVQCPKQGIIPHDMVHYAVESSLLHRGFLSMIEGGEALRFTTVGGAPEEAVERLVECFQAEMWGGRVASVELLATYVHACEARGHAPVPVTAADVEAIRGRLDELTAEWGRVRINESLELAFTA